MGDAKAIPSFEVKPVANPAAIVKGDKYRFTVLTDGLLRYEWAADNKFEDRASVFAVNRNLPNPDFRVKEHNGILEIITSKFHLTYNQKEFHPATFEVVVKGTFHEHASVWRYGQVCANLGGTARTLDEVDGRTTLGPGVISRNGFTTIDDSESMLFADDGYVATRLPGNRVDGYLFAYGHDFRGAMKAFYSVSGSQPLLPRWALGNWWSRYYAYKQQEYLDLMDEFKEKDVPLSVAVIDMDWHVTESEEIAEAGKTGWTGYTWNKKLFPDPSAFLKGLHDRHLKVTLNDHPADGVQFYEDVYAEMCRVLKHDPTSKDPIHFDITDRAFLQAFFDILHRPLEDQGTDFWWIDWQQGSYSRIPGIDPLWVLNHYHFIDNARNNKRPLTFSRYAGPGSHRYPVGFSGDTIVSWPSLDFQPEFTATASNIGYGWWSHDIGGHMGGEKDDELVTRWVQFGVFSPIMRLHSSNNLWNSKEPWNFRLECKTIMTEYLQFRHRLIPYIYSMNARSVSEGTPLILPMYWDFPSRNEAYRVPNQYYFGSELIVCPITSPQDSKILLGSVKAWLPPGNFVDIFNGAVYSGDREIWLSRPLSQYPVLAKEGAIIPLDAALVPENGGENPPAFEILVAVGKDGYFEIIEDDGLGSGNVQFEKIPIAWTQSSGTLEIGAPKGSSRDFIVTFLGISKLEDFRISVNGNAQSSPKTKVVSNGIQVHVGPVARAGAVIEIGKDPQMEKSDAKKLIRPILAKAQINYSLKEEVWRIVQSERAVVSRLLVVEMEEGLRDAVLEYIL